MFIGFLSLTIAVTFIKHLEVYPPLSAMFQSGGGQTCMRCIQDWIHLQKRLLDWNLCSVRHNHQRIVSLICCAQILMTALFRNKMFLLFLILSPPIFRAMENFNIKKHIYNFHTFYTFFHFYTNLFRTWKFNLVTNYINYFQPVCIIIYFYRLNLEVPVEKKQPSRFDRWSKTLFSVTDHSHNIVLRYIKFEPCVARSDFSFTANY